MNSSQNIIRLNVSLVLISIALISYQLILIKILSIVQWYHFAYMVISVALLGFGAAGSFLSIYKKRVLNKTEDLLPFLFLLTSIFIVITVPIMQIKQIRFDTYVLFSDYSHLWRLILTYLLFMLPFFTGALAIGIIFTEQTEKIGRLYFSNLLGSGIGGIIVLISMQHYSPEQLPSTAAVFALAAGISLRWAKNNFLTILKYFSAAVIIYLSANPIPLSVSEYKSISKTLDLPYAKIIHKESSPYGLIEVVSSPALRYAPGLNINYTGSISKVHGVFNDGNWYGALPYERNDSLKHLMNTTASLPFHLQKPGNVLLLDAGTGIEAHLSYLNDAKNIVLVEQNAPLTGMIRKVLKNNSEYLTSKNISIHNISSRTFLMSDTLKYDLIMLPVIESFGGTSGLYAVSERYNLTKEAIKEMYNKLTGRGYITITAWMDYPYRNPLKIMSLLSESMEELNIKNFTNNIAAVRSWGTITYVLKRNPFDQTEIQAVREFCNKMSFDPALLPGLKNEDRERYNGLSDKSFFNYLDRIMSGGIERNNLYEEYAFNIEPPTDNKPYFSQYLKLKSIPHLADLFGGESVPYFEIGYLLIYTTFIQIFLLSIIFIILPLFKIKIEKGQSGFILFYFGGLGIGYLAAEVIFIQYFTMYFGNPVYSAAAVIGIMLLLSGTGSLFSGKKDLSRKKLYIVILLIVGIFILYSFALIALLKSSAGFSFPIKILITFIIVGVPAFLMGMPFPTALKMISTKSPAQVPWAWGINGSMSVISTAASTIIAIEFGFQWVVLTAAIAYAISFVSISTLK